MLTLHCLNAPVRAKDKAVSQPTKPQLRKHLRAARTDHVAQQADSVRALLFHRIPGPLAQMIKADFVIGLYHAAPGEAPTAGYAAFFYENAHPIVLPHFSDKESPMDFREHTDPLGHSDLERGPFGILQPSRAAPQITPDLLFVPLIGFTERGERLGQGGGHYDRYLAAHPQTLAIGLAWDVQCVEELPSEPHDQRLDAVVTPTRFLGPF